MIGIVGKAMAPTAQLLAALGHRVTGSDAACEPPMSTVLEDAGIEVQVPYSPSNLTPRPDLVVIGNAISRGNPELEEVLDTGMAYTSQAEAIEDYVLPGRRPIVLTGTHGKTTTTALTTWLLEKSGHSPGWLVGGMSLDLPSSAALGTGRPFVIEGDEYDTVYYDKRPKFHHYRPYVVAVLNLEFDHADIYPDFASIELEFRRLLKAVPRKGTAVLSADSAPVLALAEWAFSNVLTFGFAAEADLRAEDVTYSSQGAEFTAVVASSGETARLSIPLHGAFNVQNALAAIAIALTQGITLEELREPLQSFQGVRDRMQSLTGAGDIEVLSDFAHHPTAIEQTLQGARGRGVGNRLWAIVEPRSFTMRTRVHQVALADALAHADVVLLAPLYNAQAIPDEKRIDLGTVVDKLIEGGREAHILEPDEIIAYASEHAQAGDVILVMSSGEFFGVPKRLAAALED